MEAVFNDDDAEIYENNQSPTTGAMKRHSAEDSKVTAAAGVKLNRLVVVSFGLLCILQAALNVSLRLSHCVEAKYQNLTEEKDELMRKLDNCSNVEARYKNLTAEKDELVRKLDNCSMTVSQQTEARKSFIRELGDFQWVYFGGSLYYTSSLQKSWQESRDDCLQKGANLMIVNSKEEQNFTRQFKKYMWIGLTDSETEGRWKWVDGTPMTTSYWGSKEPNGGKDENCGEIKYFDAEDSWNDESCSVSHFWICEKKIPT